MVALTLDDSDPVVILHAGGALVIDFSLGTRFLVKLSGNVTGISVIGHVAKNVRQVMFLQDSTGGRTVTWLAPGFRYPRGNPTINTAVNGRTVVLLSLLPSFPTVFTVIDVPKPDRFWYAVELAVLLASGPLVLSDAAKANVVLDNVPNATFLAKGSTAGLAPKASPVLTGTPEAPTATLGTNTTQISTTAFVQAALAALINSAPGALDTLDELAAAMGDDANFAATVTTALAGKQPLDADLTTLAANGAPGAKGLALLLAGTSADVLNALGISAFVQTLLDDADGPTARATLGVTGRNYVENPAFDVWQAGTTFAIAASTSTFLADRWKTLRGVANSTVSRQAGFAGARYCLRSQRDSGDTAVNGLFAYHQLEGQMAQQLAGRTVVLSADVRAGANFSAVAGVRANIFTGTGVDEVISLATATFTTGSVTTSLGDQVIAAGATARLVWTAHAVPSGVGDIAFRFSWTPAGTAGAADYIEITNVKLEVGSATAFEPPHPAETMERCLRHYEKSFSLGTAPQVNLGVNTGEECRPAPAAGAVTERLGTVTFKTRKRATPTITTYNPAAAGAEVRDETASANCTATTAANVNDRGFKLTCTGAAGTTVGGELGFHWVADARL